MTDPRTPPELLADLDASLAAGRDWLIVDPAEGSTGMLEELARLAARRPGHRGEVTIYVAKGETAPSRTPDG